VSESTTAGASGFVSTGLSAEIDHELMRNVLVGANLGYTENDYKGIDRTEQYWDAGANVDYLLNRNFRVGLGYKYRSRDVDTAATEDYSRNIVTLSLKGSL